MRKKKTINTKNLNLHRWFFVWQFPLNSLFRNRHIYIYINMYILLYYIDYGDYNYGGGYGGRSGPRGGGKGTTL